MQPRNRRPLHSGRAERATLSTPPLVSMSAPSPSLLTYFLYLATNVRTHLGIRDLFVLTDGLS